MNSIKEYEGLYHATESGEIINSVTGNVLSQCKNSRGYANVVLIKNTIKSTKLAHRLICFAFKMDSYFAGAHVNHINGNKLDNRPVNLEWVTGSENMKHAYATGLQKVSEVQKKATAKYCVENFSKKVIQKDLQGNIVAEFISASEAARQTGFCQTHICSVARGKLKTCHNFKFEYANN